MTQFDRVCPKSPDGKHILEAKQGMYSTAFECSLCGYFEVDD